MLSGVREGVQSVHWKDQGSSRGIYVPQPPLRFSGFFEVCDVKIRRSTMAGCRDFRSARSFSRRTLSNAAQRKVLGRMISPEGQEDPVFKLRVTLFGKVGMVITWYFDGNLEGYDDFVVAARLVRLVPELLAGRVKKFTESDLFALHDALASFPKRDEDLEAVNKFVYREWEKRVRAREESEGE